MHSDRFTKMQLVPGVISNVGFREGTFLGKFAKKYRLEAVVHVVVDIPDDETKDRVPYRYFVSSVLTDLDFSWLLKISLDQVLGGAGF